MRIWLSTFLCMVLFPGHVWALELEIMYGKITPEPGSVYTIISANPVEEEDDDGIGHFCLIEIEKVKGPNVLDRLGPPIERWGEHRSLMYLPGMNPKTEDPVLTSYVEEEFKCPPGGYARK